MRIPLSSFVFTSLSIAGLMLGRVAGGQSSDDSALNAAVAAHARRELPAGTRVGFDPAKPALRRSATAPDVGADSHAARAARALQGRLVHTADVLSCEAGPTSCRLKDVDAVVHWPPATVSGDSAVVTLFIVRTTGFARIPIQQMSQHILLVRRGSGWQVEQVKLGRVT